MNGTRNIFSFGSVMEETYAWGGHAKIVLIFLILSGYLMHGFPLFMFLNGKFAFVIIGGIFFILFAIPFMSLHVSFSYL